MSENIDISEARERLSELTRRANKGETFIITRYGKPFARIVPSDHVLEDVIIERVPPEGQTEQQTEAQRQAARDKLLRDMRKGK